MSRNIHYKLDITTERGLSNNTLNKRQSTRRHKQAGRIQRTQGGSVVADEPAVIDEEWSQADRKHGGREEEEQNVELRLSLREAFLRGEHIQTETKVNKNESTLLTSKDYDSWSDDVWS